MREDKEFSYTKWNTFSKSSMKVETKCVVKEIVMRVYGETTYNARDYLIFQTGSNDKNIGRLL